MTIKANTPYDRLPNLLTVTECCTMLRVSRETLRPMLHELKAVKVGREWRVSKEQLRNYLEGVNNE